LNDLRFVRVGEHRHLVAALWAGVDDRERTTLRRADALQLHRGITGYAQKLHCEGSLARSSSSRCAIPSRARPTGVSDSSMRWSPRSHWRASSGSNGIVPRQGISRLDTSGETKSGLIALQSRQEKTLLFSPEPGDGFRPP